MEQQIQDLINSIKKDGIESATNESKRIIEEAEKKAEKILSDAKSERDRMLRDGEKELKKEMERNTEALKMASRDLSLSFKKDVEKRFQDILDEKVSSSFDESVLKELIVSVIKAEFNSDTVVVLPEDKKKALTSGLVKEIKSSLENGVEFAFSTQFNGGFKVMDKDGRAYVDLSDEEVTKLLYPYLSSAVRDII